MIRADKNEENKDEGKVEKDPKYLEKIREEYTKGTKFDETFELLEEIKSGSVGRVFKAKIKKIQFNRFSACKFLLEKKRERQGNNSKNESNNGNIEISIHGKLKHKYIPFIYGYYKINNGTCIAMEYSKYGDLENFKRTIIKRSSLSETLICYFAGQIL